MAVDDLARASMLEAELVGADMFDPSPAEPSDLEKLQQEMEKLRASQRETEEQLRQEARQAAHDREMAERRRADTERWAQDLNAKRIDAERYAQQAAQVVQQQQQLAPPPPVRSEEFDSVLTDPAKFQGTIDARVNYGYQLARAESQRELQQYHQAMEQRLSQLTNHFGQAMAPVNNLGATQAEQAAEAALTAKGFSADQFRAALPGIRQALNQSQLGLAMNSDAIALGFLHQHLHSPASPGRQEPPMSLKSDVSTTSTAPGTKQALTSEARYHLNKISEALGPEVAKKVAEARKRGEV